MTGIIQLLLFLPLTSWWVWPVRRSSGGPPGASGKLGARGRPAAPRRWGASTRDDLRRCFQTGAALGSQDREGLEDVSLSNLFAPVPPSPWDKFFMEPPADAKFPTPDGQFLIVTFNDGSQVAGVYYGPAWVATSPQVQGLFLAQEYTLDKKGRIDKEVIVSRGRAHTQRRQHLQR